MSVLGQLMTLFFYLYDQSIIPHQHVSQAMILISITCSLFTYMFSCLLAYILTCHSLVTRRHTDMLTCFHIFLHSFLHANIQSHVHKYINVCLHTCLQAIASGMLTYMLKYKHAFMRMCLQTCFHAYIHVFILSCVHNGCILKNVPENGLT